MLRTIHIIFLVLVAAIVSGCQVETYPSAHVLHIPFSLHSNDHSGWAASTKMVLHYRGLSYSQEEIIDYHQYYTHSRSATIDEISWLLWELGDIESVVTGTLSFAEIQSHIDLGEPVILQYGDYYDGHYVVLHGYDDDGYVYIHEPYFGTSVIHYEDLYHRYFHGKSQHWSSSLIVSDWFAH